MVFDVDDSFLKIKTEFPRKVREIKHTWIPMSDGTRLAARIWLPEDAEENPVPAILEYIPYRKNDFTALRDSIRHPYFAGHGYASIRVDLRGSGDSEGILYDEYLPQEQDDAIDVLQWIEEQPWCTGKVGMIGKSWGGFTGLQVAARRPSQLKAVITLCSTDDRYSDDVHYMGGNMLASNMLWWASTMLAYNARPADPKVVGDKWKSMWLDRLEKTPPFVEEWVRHQRRDEYWKHGSVCENYADIEIPVYAVGGWADGYTNAIFRLLEGLPGPKKGLIGPWAHEYPEVALPGPQIGFLQECLRWWDYWLKGLDTGIMDEPMLRAWIQDYVEPADHYDYRPGRWVAESTWPTSNVEMSPLYLSETYLSKTVSNNDQIIVSSVQEHGHYHETWCPFGQPGDMALDQRIENGFATVFTSEPAKESVEILGFPELSVELSSDKENALLAVRLCDVAPTGESTLVTWGMLNLTHRNSDEHPQPLVPGEKYNVNIKLNAIGYKLPEGHRWQVALSPTYWPHAWPSPEEATLTVFTGEHTKLSLPIREPQLLDKDLEPFKQPSTAPLLSKIDIRDGNRTRKIEHDTIEGVWRLIDFSDEGKRKLVDDGIEYGSTNYNVYTIQSGKPLSANVQCEWTLEIGRGDWQTKVETLSTMSANKDFFILTNEIDAYEGEEKVFHKRWDTKVPRDHM